MGITINGFDDVLKTLNKLSDKSKVDGIAKKAVDAAKDVVASSMRSAIAASEHGPRATGAVSASVTVTATKENSFGIYAVAKPTGHHPSGKSNAAVAAFLEYGTPTLNARPWRSRAVSSAEGPCKQIIEDYVKSEMGAD